jgi:hypothetical protein
MISGVNLGLTFGGEDLPGQPCFKLPLVIFLEK